MRELGGARVIEEGDQFLGVGLQEGPEGKAGEDLAVLLEEVLEVLDGVGFLQSGRPQAELHHAFDLAKDVVLAKHRATDGQAGEGRFAFAMR